MAKELDELYSLRKFINDHLSGLPGIDSNPVNWPIIYVSRPEEAAGMKRPAFRIQSPMSTDQIVSKQWYLDLRSWIVTYYGKASDRSVSRLSREDASNVGEAIAQTLRRNRVIPLTLYNYVYPIPILREVTALGTGLNGQYNVQLLGEDLLGNITFLSQAVGITITAGSGIDVQCVQYPSGIPLAKKIHVYLAFANNPAHRLGSVNMGVVDQVFRITADVPGGVASGGNAPQLGSNVPSTSKVRYRQMSVVLPVRSEIVQDPEEDALFNTTIRFTTRTPNVLDYDHSLPVTKVTTAETIH